MRSILLIIKFLLLGIFVLNGQNKDSSYESKNLRIKKLSKNSYVHVSYLNTESFGKVSCNGMVFINEDEAVVIDTPVNQKASKELINWIENTMHSNLKGIVVTHFHEDGLGGLSEFHLRGINSFSNLKTIDLARSNNNVLPQNEFETSMELKLGNEKLIVEYFGEGHTVDNSVCYFPKDKVMFGGCLIKAIGANKGYFGDANVEEWSNTVLKIKSKYPIPKIIVVPGHGNHGNSSLFDYTINLFKN